jgi:hypothetical protein
MTVKQFYTEYLMFSDVLLRSKPENRYMVNHNNEALLNPWVMMFRGLHGYCVKTEKAWGSPAEDYVLAPEIMTFAKALQNLLNFDNGQLDSGKCDSALRELLADAGFTPEQVEEL